LLDAATARGEAEDDGGGSQRRPTGAIRAAPDIHETPEIVARGVDFDLVVVCKLCAECDTFPCVLDAAIFSAQDKDA
jgi:hypothetical protein